MSFLPVREALFQAQLNNWLRNHPEHDKASTALAVAERDIDDHNGGVTGTPPGDLKEHLAEFRRRCETCQAANQALDELERQLTAEFKKVWCETGLEPW